MSKHIQVTPTHETSNQLLEVDSLSVQFTLHEKTVYALRNVSLDIRQGEIVGLAGESGSGKSTLALAILQYLDSNGTVSEGKISFKGQNLLEKTQRELRSLRGTQIAHVAQNPGKALNPSMRVGKQIRETIKYHQDISDDDRLTERVRESLERVNIPDPEATSKSYPHELSGGMQQRAIIAMALSCNPEMLILDEPTTGLDVTTQAKILDLVEQLKEQEEVGILLITHDLGVIAQAADRVNILYAGEMMEKGSVDEVFMNPANPYTQGLLATTPTIEEDKQLKPIPGQIPNVTDPPAGCIFADRCEFAEADCRSGSIELEAVDDGHETRCRRWQTARDNPIKSKSRTREKRERGDKILEIDGLKKFYGQQTLLDRVFDRDDRVKAVNGVSLDIHEGEAVGLVGESGCGKSTLGRTLLQLEDITEGTVSYRGSDLASLDKEERQQFRSECQIIFQNPETSLNPKKSVYELLERPLKVFTDKSPQERERRIVELLEQVNLSPQLASNYPHELSGGQQQRVAIAEAFAAEPSFVVLDEPVSSLDVSVQASILDLLENLRSKYGTSYLLISHNLSVVKSLCDRIAVMYLGELAEVGDVDDIFTPPYHPYTRALLSSIPPVDPAQEYGHVQLEGDVPSPRNPPTGCSFHSRCPQKIGDICEQEDPQLEASSETDGDHCIACHLDTDQMSRNLDTDM